MIHILPDGIIDVNKRLRAACSFIERVLLWWWLTSAVGTRWRSIMELTGLIEGRERVILLFVAKPKPRTRNDVAHSTPQEI